MFKRLAVTTLALAIVPVFGIAPSFAQKMSELPETKKLSKAGYLLLTQNGKTQVVSLKTLCVYQQNVKKGIFK